MVAERDQHGQHYQAKGIPGHVNYRLINWFVADIARSRVEAVKRFESDIADFMLSGVN